MTAAPDFTGFDHHTITVNGVNLHYVEGGERSGRPSVILVHGWPQHFGIWRDVAEALAADHHVIAVDLRGHGWSSIPRGRDAYDKRVLADDLEHLIVALGLNEPVLVGHDWGGWVALLVAGRHRVKVRGVVTAAIVAPWAGIPLRSLWRFAYQLVAAGPWGSFAHRWFDQKFLRTIFAVGAGGRELESVDGYLERYRDRKRARAGSWMYRQFLLGEFGDMLNHSYARPVTDVPVLMVAGSDDPVLTPKLVRRAQRAAKNVEVETIDGVGHWIPEQKPHVLVEKLRHFLRH